MYNDAYCFTYYILVGQLVYNTDSTVQRKLVS